MTPRKLRNFCELDWPSFDVGWLPEGTLDLPAVQAVHQVVTGTPGHPGQFPHIDSCLLIAQTLPPWARFCMNRQRQSRVFVAQPLRKKKEGKKPISQGDPVEDPLLPLPYVPLTPQAPGQSALDPLRDSPPLSLSPAPTHEQDSSLKPVGKPLHSAKQSSHQAAARQMPLRETQGPQQVNEDGSVQPGRSISITSPSALLVS